MSSPSAKLYVILGSHACRTGMLLLDHKGIGYELVELPTGLHPFALRLHGFAGGGADRELGGDRRSLALALGDRAGTVPALRINGDRVQTNREIARHLERIQPDPPLYPASPKRRGEVEEAERWGDQVLQMVARRLALAGILHGPEAMHRRGADGRLGPLLWRRDRVRFAGTRIAGRFIFAATREAEPRLLAELPAQLDRIDAWIEAGVLNSDALNAADLVIAPSVALLIYRHDLRAEIESRPVLSLVDRLLPEPVSSA